MATRGQGRIDNDDNGLKDFISPINRKPLKGDVVTPDAPPNFKPKDPLGYFPDEQLKGYRGNRK